MKKLLSIFCLLAITFPGWAQTQGTALRATNGTAWNRLTIGSGTLVGNITGATNFPMAGHMGAGGVNTAASNGLPGLVWTSSGNGGGYWTSNTALSGVVTTNMDLIVPGPGGFQTNTHLFSGGILVVSNTATGGSSNYLAAGSRVTVVTNGALWTVSANAQTNAMLENLANTGAITNVLAGSNSTVQIANFVATVNSIPPRDGVNITNLVYAPVIIPTAGISVATNTDVTTGLKSYTLTITGTNTALVTNVVLAAGARIVITTNGPTDWTVEADPQTNAVLANIALTGAITNVVAGSNTTVQVANHVATVNAILGSNPSQTAIFYPSGTNAVTATTGTEIRMSGPTNETWLTAAPGILQFFVPQGNVPVGGGGEFWIRMNNSEWPNSGLSGQTVLAAQGNVINIGDSASDGTSTHQTVNIYGTNGINLYGPVDYIYNSLQVKSSDSTVQALKFSDTKGSLTNGLFTGDAGGLTNLNPTKLTMTDGPAPVAISGWAVGDIAQIVTNANSLEGNLWFDSGTGYWYTPGFFAALGGFVGEGSGLTNVPGSIVISGIGIGVATNTVAATGAKTYTLTYTGTNSVTVTNVTLRAGSGMTVTTNAATDWTVSTGLTNSTATVGVVGTGSVGTNLSTLAILAASTNHFTGNMGVVGGVTVGQLDTPTNSVALRPDFSIAANYFGTNANFTFLTPANVDASGTKFQTTVCHVTNSSGATITAAVPSPIHSQGRFFVTNVTAFTFTQLGQKWTNCIALPLW
jgi:hypothetical protein